MPKPRRSEYTCTPSVLIWTFCFAFPRYFDLSVKSARNAQTKTLGVHLYAAVLLSYRFFSLFFLPSKQKLFFDFYIFFVPAFHSFWIIVFRDFHKLIIHKKKGVLKLNTKFKGALLVLILGLVLSKNVYTPVFAENAAAAINYFI